MGGPLTSFPEHGPAGPLVVLECRERRRELLSSREMRFPYLSSAALSEVIVPLCLRDLDVHPGRSLPP